MFNRADFLNVLKGYEGRNSILVDFRYRLQELADKTESYSEWTRDDGPESSLAWEGFYRLLEGELDTSTRPGSGWGDVPNPSGGFLGFWWYPSDKSDMYLQIEGGPAKEPKLCFKVDADGEDSEQQEQMKWQWHERVRAAGGQQVVEPNVMRRGNTMTVAWWKDDWMAFDRDGKLDVPGTVENLRRAEAVLKRALEA